MGHIELCLHIRCISNYELPGPEGRREDDSWSMDGVDHSTSMLHHDGNVLQYVASSLGPTI